MINEIIYRCKNSKLFFALTLSFVFVLLLDIVMLIFDVIKFLNISNGISILSFGFFIFNIVVVLINLIFFVVLLFFYLKSKYRKVSRSKF